MMQLDDFLETDRQLFERLHHGSLEPLVVDLLNGDRICGQLLFVHRAGAIGAARAAPSGRICLQTADGPIAVEYSQIRAIA